MPLVILRVSREAYVEIRQRLIDGGARNLILHPRYAGEPERLNMGEIALESLP